MRTLSLLLLVVLSDASQIHGQACTIQVAAGSDTIQEAIDRALDGDVICVGPGTYVENLNFLGKAIIVRSTNGPAVTIIDGSAAGAAVTFNNGEESGSVLEGFTVTNGDPEILCQASPTIRNNTIDSVDTAILVYNYGTPGTADPTIVGNSLTGPVLLLAETLTVDDASVAGTIVNNTISSAIFGGADTSCRYALGQATLSTVISGNVVTGDSLGRSISFAGYDGDTTGWITHNTLRGGVLVSDSGYCGDASVTIAQNTFTSGGVNVINFASAVVDGNIITNRSGPAVRFGAVGSLTVANNTISGSDPGVQLEVAKYYYTDVLLRNNLITDNSTGVRFVIRSDQEGHIEGLLVNNTVTQNSGPGVSVSCRGDNSEVALVVQDGIIWGNGGDSIDTGAAGCTFVPDVSFSLIAGGYPGTGNFDADPLFVSGPASDFYLSQIAAGQAVDSPGVDAGDPSLMASTGTTRTDGTPDAAVGDVGFHHPSLFVRGDCNGSGTLEVLGDALYLLNHCFLPGTVLPPPCLEACDANDNGTLECLVDALFILRTILGCPSPSPCPPAPFPACGPDPDPATNLGCHPTCP